MPGLRELLDAAIERHVQDAQRTPYDRGYAAAREAHADDRAVSDSPSDLALRTLGRLQACSGATRHNWQAGFLAGLADAAEEGRQP